jgi:Ni,Fe-hydrogenase I cytochrome b subunit
MKELSKAQTIILFIIFVVIGGLILYGVDTKNNFSPLDYVFKR